VGARIVLPASKRLPSNSSYSPETSSVASPATSSTRCKHRGTVRGYDQHDCQELASYVLDALHEDTNHQEAVRRETRQGEDESDEEASIKACSCTCREKTVVSWNILWVKSKVEYSVPKTAADACQLLSIPFISGPIPTIGKNAASGVQIL
jgi:ubiquitin C-terminal hydrolase